MLSTVTGVRDHNIEFMLIILKYIENGEVVKLIPITSRHVSVEDEQEIITNRVT